MRKICVFALAAVVCASSTALADKTTDARRYFQKGMALLKKKRLDEGVSQLEKAYAIKPHSSVLYNIAVAYEGAGRLEEAIVYFKRYVALDPHDSRAVRKKIRALTQRKGLGALVNAGMKAIRQGRYLRGIELLKRANRQRPHPNLIYNIARAYESAGKFTEADSNYEAYLKTNPRDAKKVEERRNAMRERQAQKKARALAQKSKKRRSSRRRKRSRQRVARPEQLASKLEHKEETSQAAESADAIAEAAEVESLQASSESPVEESKRVSREQEVHAALQQMLPEAEPPEEEAGSRSAVYEDVVVTAERRAQTPLESPNAVTILTAEDIRLSGARTLPDLFRRVPGVDVMSLSYSEYNVAIRGFNRRVANKVLVLINNRTAYQDYLGLVLWTRLNIDLLDIERIEIVRGPGSAIFGAYAYTGTINIITKRPYQLDGTTVQAGYGNGGQLRTVVQHGGQRGQIGFRMTGGYEEGDKYSLEFDPDRVDYEYADPDPRRSLSHLWADGMLEYRTGADSYGYAGFGANSGLGEAYGVQSLRNTRTVIDRELKTRLGYQSPRFAVQTFLTTLAGGIGPAENRVGVADTAGRIESSLFSFEPTYRPVFNWHGEHRLVLGADYRFKHLEWDWTDGKQDEHHWAIYGQDSWRISDRLTAVVSARLDVSPVIGPLGSPRAAAVYRLGETQSLRLSLGTAFRQPTQAETYIRIESPTPVAGAAVLLEGSTDLEAENVVTLDAGYRYYPSFGEFELVGYASRISNRITVTPLISEGVDAELQPDLASYRVARSRYINESSKFVALGAEASARLYPVDGLDFGVNYAFQYIYNEESKDRFTDSPLHKFSVWGMYRSRFGLDLGFSGHLVSSQDWVEPQYDPTDPTGFDSTPLPLPQYFTALGRIGYRMFDDQMELAVSSYNIFDVGENRHREHPFGNRLEHRVMGSLTVRYK